MAQSSIATMLGRSLATIRTLAGIDVQQSVSARLQLVAPTQLHTVGTTPVPLFAANPDRIRAELENHDGGVTLFVDESAALTPTTARYRIEPGDGWRDTDTLSAWYGVTASGTADVRCAEFEA